MSNYITFDLYRVKILCQVIPNSISNLNILLNRCTTFYIKSFFCMSTGRVFLCLYFYTSISEKKILYQVVRIELPIN